VAFFVKINVFESFEVKPVLW